MGSEMCIRDRVSMEPDAKDVEGFERFIERYKNGIAIEQSALKNLV